MQNKKLKTGMGLNSKKPDSNDSEIDNSIGDKRLPNWSFP